MADLVLPDARDWIGALEAGQKAGMTDRTNRATRQAGSLMTGGDYSGAARAIMPYDMRTGVAIQGMGTAAAAEERKKGYGASVAAGKGDQAVKSASAAGDFEIAKELQTALDAADDRQKKVAHEHASRIAEIVAPLGDIPATDMAARKAYIAQHVSDLTAAGYTQEQIASFEPSDANLATIYTQALGLKDYLEKTAPKVVGNALVKPDGAVVYRDPQVRTVGAGERLVEYGGEGQGAAVDAPAPTAPLPTGGMYATIGQLAQTKGAKPEEVGYLQRLAQVESHGDASASNGSSTGVFQFHPDTFASVGGGNIHDVGDQTAAALTLSRRDRAALHGLGVEPTDANVYIMHQQGPGGGPAILTAPAEVGAVAALTPAYKGNAERARQAIVGNGGTAEMTAGQFRDMWRARWANGGKPVSQAGPAAAPAASPGGVRVLAEGAPKAKSRPATAAEKAQYGIAADVPAQIDPDGDFHVITGTGAAMKRVPAKVAGGYAENAKSLGQIDRALALVKANPKAFGLANVVGDEIRQRTDPNGIKPRAAVAEVGAVKIHDLSGAAVTAAETPRLKPFVPMPTDTADAIIQKLEQLRGQIENSNAQIEVQFGEEAGYTPLVHSAPAAAKAPAKAAPAGKAAHKMTDAEIKAALGI